MTLETLFSLMKAKITLSRHQRAIKRSALFDLYEARGVTLVRREDWLLPAHFGDPIEEYNAVRNRVGILDLCQRNLLCVTGHDRTGLLNNMISNDLNALQPGQGLHAAFTDLRGNILSDARVFCSRDSLIVDIPEARKETLLRYLRHRFAGDEVRIEDLFHDYTMLSVQGPHAEQLVRETASPNDGASEDLAHFQVTIADSTVTLIAVTHGAEMGYDLVIPVSKLPNVVARIEQVGKRWRLSWVGAEAQEILRIEAGIPLYGIDMTQNNSLLESGQDRWISLNKQFAGLTLESKQPVQPGAKIYDGEREIGSITSCRFSPRLDAVVALGYIQRDYLTPNTRVMIKDGGKSLVAIVSSLPIQ